MLPPFAVRGSANPARLRHHKYGYYMSTRHDPWTREGILGSSSLLSIILAICAGSPMPSPGLGFRIPNQDAEAIGRGNAFIATANNPSAIYYNPAGISQLKGSYFQYGAHSIVVNSEYKSAGAEFDSEMKIQPVPQVFYTRSIGESPFTFGFGIYAPHGLGLEWPGNAPFHNSAHEGKLLYANVNPVLAYKVNDQLSIAFGPAFVYSKVKLRQGIAAPGDEFKFIGDDIDYSLHAGVRWQPHEQWAVGLTYHGPSTLNYHGKSTLRPYAPSQGTSVEVDFPQFIMAGVSYRPTPKWNLEIGVDWTDWDSFNSITFENTTTPAGSITVPFNWESSWMYHAGASYYFDNPYYVSAGYFLSENSTSTRDFNPIVPDTDLHVMSIGVGYKGKRWTWALAAQVIVGPVREVRGAAGAGVDGDYQFFNQAINFSLGYHY
jgi:long-chain fatty acid transport protein